MTFSVRKSQSPLSRTTLFEKRRIIGKDNVGDPIYEGDEQSGGISVLGAKVNLDAPTLAAIGFGMIAFNFFVLANL